MRYLPLLVIVCCSAQGQGQESEDIPCECPVPICPPPTTCPPEGFKLVSTKVQVVHVPDPPPPVEADQSLDAALEALEKAEQMIKSNSAGGG